jgi:hypothetical protein
MKEHEVYKSIICAYKIGTLKEPITSKTFRNACPGWKDGTYSSFLGKHAKGNPYGISELFIDVSQGVYPREFKFIRPFKYGLEDILKEIDSIENIENIKK